MPSVVHEMRRQNVQFIDPRKKKKKRGKTRRKWKNIFLAPFREMEAKRDEKINETKITENVTIKMKFMTFV